MKRCVMGVMLLATVGGAVLADTKADADADKVLGAWDLTSIEIKGKKTDATEGGGGTFIFAKDNKLTIKDKGKQDKGGTFKMDASKSPKEIDLIEGADGEKLEAIYDLDGDTLRLAISPQGPKGKRPTALDSKQAILLVMKRQKK